MEPETSTATKMRRPLPATKSKACSKAQGLSSSAWARATVEASATMAVKARMWPTRWITRGPKKQPPPKPRK